MIAEFFRWLGLEGPQGPPGPQGATGEIGISDREHRRLKERLDTLEGELGAVKKHLKIYVVQELQPATVFRVESSEMIFTPVRKTRRK